MQRIAGVAGERRAASFERLAGEVFDLLVIGGGIVGAGVAALAARHGLAVALVDRGDFASGTSSASSKLVHGGLRYLRLGDFALVRQALRESNVLATVVAPHLVRSLDFVLPVYESAPYGKNAVRAGLTGYSILGGSLPNGSFFDARRARRLVPALRLEGLRGAGFYRDAQTDDARLCLANVRAAADAGAAVVNHAEVVELLEIRGALRGAVVADRLGGGTYEVEAPTIVNASGPWVDAVRRLEDSRAGTTVVLSKGIHLVLERDSEWEAALTIPLDQTRVSFAIPWQGMLLLGTTEASFAGDPAHVEPTVEEERQVLTEASIALDLDPSAIRFRFAGLRVLPATAREPARVRREVTLSRGPKGMLSVAGGKLTTYRLLALGVVDTLRPQLGLRRLDRAPSPLPGATEAAAEANALAAVARELDRDVAAHLARSYGSLSHEILAIARAVPDGFEPLATGAPEIVAQVHYGRDCEWAATVDDVLRRRTSVAVRGCGSEDVRARVESILGQIPAVATP